MKSQNKHFTPDESQPKKQNLPDMCRQADQLFFRMLFQPKQGGCLMSTVTTPSTINGVNVEQLGDNIHAIKSDPTLATFSISRHQHLAQWGTKLYGYQRILWHGPRRHDQNQTLYPLR